MRWDQSMLKESLSENKGKITRLTMEGNHRKRDERERVGEEGRARSFL